MIKKILKLVILKYRFLRLKLINSSLVVGDDFFCGKYVSISKKNTIKIGKHVYIGNNCHLAADAIIGNNIMLASYVSLVGGDHKIDYINTPIRYSGRDKFRTIHIHDDVWVGHGAIIMHGVTINSGAVIAAGAVVTKDVEKNMIVGGNPAKKIRMRRFND